MNRRVLAAVSMLGALGALCAACSSDKAATGTANSSEFATTTAAPTTPSPSTSATVSTVPVATTPLAAEQVRLHSIATLPGALDLAYRTGDTALYIATREGKIWAIRGSKADATPVLDIGSVVVAGGEQGLLGLTFASDGQHAYVDYTNTNGNTVIAEYAVDTGGIFAPASQRPLLTITQPFPNHNGGSVRIGPDGYLYIGMGDGGGAGDPNRRALNTGDLLGKILRIDPKPSPDAPYTIPPDNPFVGVRGALPEIWAVGMRNPWRFSFDRVTRDFWIADVGQDTWEEVDVAWSDEGAGRGANFGWSAFEGTHRFNADQPDKGVTMPAFEYKHGDAGCSISGGVRYRGAAIASLVGWYVYGDYCSGQLRARQINDAGRPDRAAGREITLSSAVAGVSAVTQGPDGEVYALCVESGTVFALQPAS